MNNKNAFASKTLWGIVLAAAGTIADSGTMLSDLLGVEWAGKAVLIAGLVLAFWGRLSASKQLTLLPCLALGLILIGGCAPGAGQAARESLLTPAAVAAWGEIEPYAQRGVEDAIDDNDLTEGTAAFPLQLIDRFGQEIDALGGTP